MRAGRRAAGGGGAARFPEAQLVDPVERPHARGTLLKDALRESPRAGINLVIGTQLVAKGHHFPHLTLVGVVDADLALETSDPRAGERTWQLLAQVAGRAGRGEKRGPALVQTYRPDHPLMRRLAAATATASWRRRSAVREAGELPPYGRLAAVIVSGADGAATERQARALAKTAPAAPGIELLGPAPAPIPLIGGRHRWRLLLRAGRNLHVQEYIRSWFAVAKASGPIRVEVDIDPYNFL